VVGDVAMKRFFVRAALLGLTLAGALPAGAAGQAVTLGDDDRRTLETVVQKARAADVRPFATLERVVKDWLVLPPGRRHGALLSMQLQAMGSAGLAPLIDALAIGGGELDGGLCGGLDPRVRQAVEVALVEALGNLDDARARPVLLGAFTEGRSPAVRAVAARGMSRTCDDAALGLLLARSSDAAVEGLGRCLRPEAAERLAALLGETHDENRAGPIAAALGRLASDLLWSAPPRRDDPAGPRIRLVAARALVAASARFDDDEPVRSLAIVRHPDTLALIDEAHRAADAAGRSRLDRAKSRIRLPR